MNLKCPLLKNMPSKLLILPSLRTNYNRTFQCETPCTWNIRRLVNETIVPSTHQPSDPAYYIEDCWIFELLSIQIKTLPIMRCRFEFSLELGFDYKHFGLLLNAFISKNESKK